VVLDKETALILQEIQNMKSETALNPVLSGAIRTLHAKLVRERTGNKNKAQVNISSDQKMSAEEARRMAWKRSNGQCEFVERASNKRCASRFRLQVDHEVPRAFGGSDAADNLRILCFQHNQKAAMKYGLIHQLIPFKKNRFSSG
jgi:hypothetical protein